MASGTAVAGDSNVPVSAETPRRIAPATPAKVQMGRGTPRRPMDPDPSCEPIELLEGGSIPIAGEGSMSAWHGEPMDLTLKDVPGLAPEAPLTGRRTSIGDDLGDSVVPNLTPYDVGGNEELKGQIIDLFAIHTFGADATVQRG